MQQLLSTEIIMMEATRKCRLFFNESHLSSPQDTTLVHDVAILYNGLERYIEVIKVELTSIHPIYGLHVEDLTVW